MNQYKKEVVTNTIPLMRMSRSKC